jgi:hypothetical protein
LSLPSKFRFPATRLRFEETRFECGIIEREGREEAVRGSNLPHASLVAEWKALEQPCFFTHARDRGVELAAVNKNPGAVIEIHQRDHRRRQSGIIVHVRVGELGEIVLGNSPKFNGWSGFYTLTGSAGAGRESSHRIGFASRVLSNIPTNYDRERLETLRVASGASSLALC